MSIKSSQKCAKLGIFITVILLFIFSKVLHNSDNKKIIPIETISVLNQHKCNYNKYYVQQKKINSDTFITRQYLCSGTAFTPILIIDLLIEKYSSNKLYKKINKKYQFNNANVTKFNYRNAFYIITYKIHYNTLQIIEIFKIKNNNYFIINILNTNTKQHFRRLIDDENMNIEPKQKPNKTLVMMAIIGFSIFGIIAFLLLIHALLICIEKNSNNKKIIKNKTKKKTSNPQIETANREYVNEARKIMSQTDSGNDAILVKQDINDVNNNVSQNINWVDTKNIPQPQPQTPTNSVVLQNNPN